MAIKRRKDIVITCPYCGAEYLPVEIYIPNEFFGRPKVIDKTLSGIIEDYCDDCMDLDYWYVCDYCNRRFDVCSLVKFRAFKPESEEFKEDYSSPLHPPKATFDGGTTELDI